MYCCHSNTTCIYDWRAIYTSYSFYFNVVHIRPISVITHVFTLQGQAREQEYTCIASFPGFYAQLLSLAVLKSWASSPGNEATGVNL